MTDTYTGPERRIRGQINTWYDYERQCWVQGDGVDRFVVLPCAHPEPQPFCYACNNPGEPADRRSPC